MQTEMNDEIESIWEVEDATANKNSKKPQRKNMFINSYFSTHRNKPKM
jgi:hypothetical protein